MSRRSVTPDGAETRVLVEFVPGPRVPEQTIADADSDEIKTRSAQAIEAALGQVRDVVERITRLQTEMPANLKQMQVDFGIKLDWEAGAMLANNQSEASISVKLTWDRDSALESAGLPPLMEEAPLPSPETPITPTGLIQAIETEPGDVAP